MADDLDERIRAWARRPGGTSSGDVAARAKLSRQAAHRRLSKLAQAGVIVREGAGRTTRYVSRDAAVVRRRYAIGVARTRTVVKLFAIGKAFVSRSEARRLMHGLDRFCEVVLDFAGIDGVGQGFVDEVFRVWAKAHPGTRLVPVSMNEPVDFMVRRGLPPVG